MPGNSGKTRRAWRWIIVELRNRAGRLRRAMTTPTEYRDGFILRVRLARQTAGFSPTQMADILRVKPNTYRLYEGPRANQPPTIMPTHLIPLFCTVCRISEKWLLAGEGRGPSHASPLPAAKKKRGESSR